MTAHTGNAAVNVAARKMGGRPWSQRVDAVLLSRRGIVLSCGALFLLLGLNALIFLNNTRTLLAQDHSVSQAQQVLTDINGLMSTMTAAESAQRGYILYDDPAYLQPYDAARHDVGLAIARLRQSVSDRPDQVQRVGQLRVLVNAKLADLAQTIVLHRTGQDAQARNIVVTDRGKAMTEALQSVFDSMTGAQLALLHAGNARAGEAAATTTITLILATAVDAALLAAVVLAFQRTFARRARLAEDRGRLLMQARQARAEAESAVKARDEFLSLAAHELRTPLTSLMGNTQLLQAHTELLVPRDQRLVAAIARGAERLRGLAEYLLDASRLGQERLDLDPRPLDLATLARHAVGEIQATVPRHTLRVAAADEAVVVAADQVRLEQTLHNLLANAVKYSPKGGEILVTVGRAGDRARVSVGDQGIGIPADALPHVFDRFYRASNAAPYTFSGLGLGLYVVREIVVQHGGTITVESTAGQGSVFTIELPLAPDAANPPVASPYHATIVETSPVSEDQGS